MNNLLTVASSMSPGTKDGRKLVFGYRHLAGMLG